MANWLKVWNMDLKPVNSLNYLFCSEFFLNKSETDQSFYKIMMKVHLYFCCSSFGCSRHRPPPQKTTRVDFLVTTVTLQLPSNRLHFGVNSVQQIIEFIFSTDQATYWITTLISALFMMELKAFLLVY